MAAVVGGDGDVFAQAVGDGEVGGARKGGQCTRHGAAKSDLRMRRADR